MTQGVPIVVAALIAAFIAVFTNVQAQRATNTQLRIAERQLSTAEQGQITDRYNAAIKNLGSGSIEVRLGGIYALQRLMLDSPRDQPTVVAVLCAFVRDQTLSAGRSAQTPSSRPPTDLQAALTVVGMRNTAHDAQRSDIAASVDFTGANLTGTNLSFAKLTFADLTRAHLKYAYLVGANFTDAFLHGADFTGAYLSGAKWPKYTPTPHGWVRDPVSGRLKRAS
jgi:hypothetical protein